VLEDLDTWVAMIHTLIPVALGRVLRGLSCRDYQACVQAAPPPTGPVADAVATCRAETVLVAAGFCGMILRRMGPGVAGAAAGVRAGSEGAPWIAVRCLV